MDDESTTAGSSAPAGTASSVSKSKQRGFVAMEGRRRVCGAAEQSGGPPAASRTAAWKAPQLVSGRPATLSLPTLAGGAEGDPLDRLPTAVSKPRRFRRLGGCYRPAANQTGHALPRFRLPVALSIKADPAGAKEATAHRPKLPRIHPRPDLATNNVNSPQPAPSYRNIRQPIALQSARFVVLQLLLRFHLQPLPRTPATPTRSPYAAPELPQPQTSYFAAACLSVRARSLHRTNCRSSPVRSFFQPASRACKSSPLPRQRANSQLLLSPFQKRKLV